MLSNEVMGALALAILWVNVLLVAAACSAQIRAVLARRDALQGAQRGRVSRGDGPEGALAARRSEQVGRAGAEALHFHDRRTEDEAFGGVVALDEGGEIAVGADVAVEVWVDAAAMKRAAACPGADVFDRAWTAAHEAPGFVRVVTATVAVGDAVFVVRPAAPSLPLLLATVDPRALLAGKAALGVAFIAATLAVAAGCTALALWPPAFGVVSRAGAVACLGFFFVIQPAGTRMRDALLVPGRLPLRTRWPLPGPRAVGPHPAQPVSVKRSA